MDCTSTPTSPTLPYVQDSIMTCQTWHRRYYCLSDINVGFNQQWILFHSNSEGYKKFGLQDVPVSCAWLAAARATRNQPARSRSPPRSAALQMWETCRHHHAVPLFAVTCPCSPTSCTSHSETQNFSHKYFKFKLSNFSPSALSDTVGLMTTLCAINPPKNPFTPHTTKKQKKCSHQTFVNKKFQVISYLHSILLCFRYLAGNFKGPAEDR